MKQLLTTLALVLATIGIEAQTLNVQQGSVTYAFTANVDDMTYTDNGQTLTIQGKVFSTQDISKITIDDTSVENNSVGISYSGTTASVVIAGNVANYVTATVNGAHVAISQTNTADVDGDEITYTLSGTTTDGGLELDGSYKCTIQLAGVTLTNPSGAAISITNKKRIEISAKSGTTNTLTDGANGSQKGSLYSKGQLQLQGKGTLNVVGNTAHAIKSGDYIAVKNLTLNITKAVKDGISCNKYFLMESGTVTISGVGDDGIQADFEEDDDMTGTTTNHEDENSGNVYIEGGTLNITTTGVATKGVKAAGDLIVSDGTINIQTTGNGTVETETVDGTTTTDAKGSAGLNADNDITINGGTITLTNSGTGGKCIKADNILTVNNGSITATNTASNYSSGSYSASAKAIKAGTKSAANAAREEAPGGGYPGGGGGYPGGGGGFPGGGGNNNNYTYTGGIVINGGTIVATAKSHEAIEAKGTISITDGYVYAEAGDDAINAASDFTISGGYVMGNSTGNDGLDANGNFYIKGGNVFAVAKGSPEVGIDANTEGGCKLYITGGNVAAVGGLENGSSLTGVTSKSTSYSKGSWYTFKNGSTAVFSMKVPSNSNMGNSMTIVATSTPSVSSGAISGTSIWNGYGVK